jgi:restriction system protein
MESEKMSRRYSKSSIELLEESWTEYEKKLDSVEQNIKIIKYDPFEVVTPKPLNASWMDEQELSINSELYILPNDKPIFDLEILIQSLPNASLPVIPNQPPLSLRKKEYPENYFTANRYNRDGSRWQPESLIKQVIKKFDSTSNESNESSYIELSQYDRDIQKRNGIVKRSDELNQHINELREQFDNVRKDEQSKLLGEMQSKQSEVIEKFIDLAHKKHELPSFLRTEYEIHFDPINSILLIQFEFPDYAQRNFIVGHRKVRYDIIPKIATANQKRNLIKACLYSLIIRFAHIAARYNITNQIKSVVVNVSQNWFDTATGQPRSGMIASLQAPIEYLKELDLTKLDPESCFKHLKGIITPSLQTVSPIRPIFTFNKDDDRVIESKNVDQYLDAEENLAAMSWEDFEHLVAQLFEWEFSKNGIEVKVTRASRDRGVDAILFDPDPLRGGKYVIQAKRYTRTVDVSAVRDLYGTVMNEGANRGILITTASYGPDSYEFAKDKPISLVDGPNLIQMLQRHGKKFRIDLEEARQLNANL